MSFKPLTSNGERSELAVTPPIAPHIQETPLPPAVELPPPPVLPPDVPNRPLTASEASFPPQAASEASFYRIRARSTILPCRLPSR